MAHVYPSNWKAVAQSEGLTAAQAKQTRDVAAPLMPSIVVWANDPAQASGFDDAALVAAFPALAVLSSNQLHAVMRIVADLVDGTYTAA